MTQPAASSLIIKLIRELSAKYEEMSFAYEFDNISNQHVIDVVPKDKFTSEEYLLDEAIATQTFIKAYPDETILFVSEDQYITIEKPMFAAGPAFGSFSYEYHSKKQSA